MLDQILDSHNVLYYLKSEGDYTIIFLYQPYKRFKPLGDGYLKIDAYYLASNELYHKVKRLKEQLADYGVTEITDDIKSLFEHHKIGGRLKNTLISIHPYGSTTALAVLKVNISCKNKIPTHIDVCDECDLCIKTCPTGALNSGFQREMCLRHGQDIIDEQKFNYSLLDNSILGCDKCQINCPLNKDEMVDVPIDLKELLKKDNFIKKAESGRKELTLLENYIGKNMVRIKRLLFFTKYAK